jgi:hypothetical protein
MHPLPYHAVAVVGQKAVAVAVADDSQQVGHAIV